jgi:hypothetical protein
MAYQFNGTNQNFRIDLAQGYACTFACWARPTNSPGVWRNLIVSDASPLTTSENSLGLGFNPSGKLTAYSFVEPSTSFESQSSTIYSANNWYHCAGIWPSNSSRTSYLNGVASTAASGTANIAPTVIWIGAFSGVADRFTGQIAEVGIWNTALTAAEIASLAKGMTCDKIRPQNLVFYAPLVRNLIDQKGGLVITNNNAATVANHPRVYA